VCPNNEKSSRKVTGNFSINNIGLRFFSGKEESWDEKSAQEFQISRGFMIREN
jgi:hypothetical protein